MNGHRQAQAHDAELRRLSGFKSRRAPDPAVPLGQEMIGFFKQSVQKRHTKFSKIAQCWGALVPEALNDHCALESFARGTLTVIVDSSSHLYELKQLLLAGLEKQLLLACRAAGLRKIALKNGRWYEGTISDRKLRFEE